MSFIEFYLISNKLYCTKKTAYLSGKCTFFKKNSKKCQKVSKFGGVVPPFFIPYIKSYLIVYFLVYLRIF